MEEVVFSPLADSVFLAAALLEFLPRATGARRIAAELVDAEARRAALRQIQLQLPSTFFLDEDVTGAPSSRDVGAGAVRHLEAAVVSGAVD
jgi:hypothetical protein